MLTRKDESPSQSNWSCCRHKHTKRIKALIKAKTQIHEHKPKIIHFTKRTNPPQCSNVVHEIRRHNAVSNWSRTSRYLATAKYQHKKSQGWEVIAARIEPLIPSEVCPDPTAVSACSICTSFPDGLQRNQPEEVKSNHRNDTKSPPISMEGTSKREM